MTTEQLNQLTHDELNTLQLDVLAEQSRRNKLSEIPAEMKKMADD